MLKNKNLEDFSCVMENNDNNISQPTFLDDFPLVEKLTDQTASTISGGAQIESGIQQVGSSSGSRRKDVIVKWANDFDSAPSFVATAEFQGNRNPNWQDAFSVTTLEKDEKRAIVRVQREDTESGWDQNLRLSWIAVST